MVAHRLVEALRSRDTEIGWRVTVLAEEPRLPYDRVALTSYFSGRDPHDLALGEPGALGRPRGDAAQGRHGGFARRRAKAVTDHARRAWSATTNWCWRQAQSPSCRR